MLGLFGEDPNEPPPKFTFSGLLALLAAAWTAWLTLDWGWPLVTSPSIVDLLLWPVLAVMLIGPIMLTLILCIFAAHFGAARWAALAAALMVAPFGVLVIAGLVTS